jgi:hypothetical protein
MRQRETGVRQGETTGLLLGRLTVRREEQPFEGWYYKLDGQTCGPVPTGRLKQLLAVGRLQPRQAVWERGSDGLLFVHAATAALGSEEGALDRRSVG